MTNLLKNPAEYAAQLNGCYGSQTGLVEIIADLARNHRQLPLDYLSDVFEELCKFDRTLVNEARSGAIARMMEDMGWDRARAALEYETDPAQRFVRNGAPETCRHCDNPPAPGYGNCLTCCEEVGGDY